MGTYNKWLYEPETDRWWVRRGNYLATVSIRKSRRWAWLVRYAPYSGESDWPKVVGGRSVGRKAFDKALAALERVSAK